jgi:hypothetical protein
MSSRASVKALRTAPCATAKKLTKSKQMQIYLMLGLIHHLLVSERATLPM